jgi:hypothetical protein
MCWCSDTAPLAADVEVNRGGRFTAENFCPRRMCRILIMWVRLVDVRRRVWAWQFHLK